jgi:hypothetical protein
MSYRVHTLFNPLLYSSRRDAETTMDSTQMKGWPSAIERDLWFQHPGLESLGYRNAMFLALPAYDPINSSIKPAIHGVHFGTALHACMIIACNAPGFLHRELISPDHPEDFARIKAEAERSFDDMLEAQESEVFTHYCFYTEDWLENPYYPLCPSFEQWSFPSKVPLEWQLCADTSPQQTFRTTCPDPSADYRHGLTKCPVTGDLEPLTAIRLIQDSYSSWVRSSTKTHLRPLLTVAEPTSSSAMRCTNTFRFEKNASISTILPTGFSCEKT